MTCRASIAIMKRKGDNESPCRNPFSVEKSKVGAPLTNIETEAVKMQPIIQDHHFPLKFICSRIESRNFQLMQLNALVKSTLKSNSFCLAETADATVSFAIKTPSRICRPLTNADWFSDTR